MAVHPKLKINRALLTNHQVEVTDETGVFSSTNPRGYGGANGAFSQTIYKYMVSLTDHNSEVVYKQYYGTDNTYPGEYQNPSIEEIQLENEPITIDSNNFNLEAFPDGIYTVGLHAIMDFPFEGTGFQGESVVVNTPGASTLYNNFQAIYVNRQIYTIVEVAGSNLILDRPVEDDFSEFYPVLQSKETLILSTGLFDCVDKKISKLAEGCGCMDIKQINELVKVQLLITGIDLAVEREDYYQANEYLKTASRLCSNCCC